MSNSQEPEDLQIPLLTEIVEGGEDEEYEEDEGDITQPHEEPPPISRMEISYIVQFTLARYLVLASKEISEKIHRQIKKKIKEEDDD